MVTHECQHHMPDFLCRACHPLPRLEINMAAVREQLDHEAAERRLARELLRVRQRIASMTMHGEPDDGTVNATVLAALRRKEQRLAA